MYSLSLPLEWSQVTHTPASIKLGGAYKSAFHSRAGGNGTAGTAMAVPVFEKEKWRRLDSNLITSVIECPLRALRRSLGCLRGL